MGDDELSEIRKRRMAQLQQQAASSRSCRRNRATAASQAADADDTYADSRARRPGTPEYHQADQPDFAGAVEQQLVALAQSGRLKQKITDAQFKELLRQLAPAKRDYSITRK